MTEFMFLNVAYRATLYRIGISIFDRITNLTISRELAIDIRIQIQVYPYFGPIVEKKRITLREIVVCGFLLQTSKATLK